MRYLLPVVLLAVCLVGCTKLQLATHERDGHRYYESRQWDKAVIEYEKVLELDPSRKEMNLYIARAQQDLLMTELGSDQADELADESLARWEKIKEIYQPEDHEYLEAEAQINDILDKTGRREIGTAYYRELVTKMPNKGNYLLLAESLFKELKFADAVEVLDVTNEKFRDDKWIHLTKAIYLWAWLYRDQKTMVLTQAAKEEVIEQGMETIEYTISLDPELATPYSYRNLLYRQKAMVDPKNTKEYMELAQADIERFKELWPKEKAWRDEQQTKVPGAPPPAEGS